MAMAIFCACLVGCGFLGGMLYGYERGVKETERRWSDAVAKAEYDRKYRNV